MGYTILYTPHPSLPYALQFHQMFPDLVKLVFMYSDDTFKCYKDTNCNVSESNPSGIPPWKIFSFAFWSGPQHPLGVRWTVSPENYTAEGLPNTTYLGYSIEQACRQYEFVPHDERENQAWILAKYLHYFTSKFEAAWSQADFDAVTAATGTKFAMGSFVKDHPEVQPELPSTYTNHGHIDQGTFMRHLSRSKVLIGMGNPVLWVFLSFCAPTSVHRSTILDRPLLTTRYVWAFPSSTRSRR
jgi:hypothetical protein